MKYSLSGFLFEEAGKNIPFDDFCGLAAGLGYDGVELRRTQVNLDTPKSRRRELLDCIRSEGLSATCLTTRSMPKDGKARDDFFLSYLELCDDMRCRLLKTSGEPEWMNWAADKAESGGISVAINNHVGSITETVAGTETFLRETCHSNAGLLYDPRHLYHGGENYLDAIQILAPYILNVLVQSIRPTNVDEGGELGVFFVRCMPDDPGAQDWREIYRQLEIIGYRGLVTVIENGWPPPERETVARRNIEFLRGLEVS